MKKFNALFILVLVIARLNIFAQASNPTPFDLSLSNYSFNAWSEDGPLGTFPESAVIHRSAGNDPTIISFNPSNDYALAYNLTSGSRVNGEGEQGLSFINTVTSGNLGAFVLALNTEGRGNITVNFTAGTLVQGNGSPLPREYRIRMQYRIGTSSTWQNFQTIPEYSSLGQAVNHEQVFSGIVLPPICNDQPVVQLRWLYHSHAANDGGTRPKLRLDDINVSSEVYICETPTASATDLDISNILANQATISWTNGSGLNRIVLLTANQVAQDLPVDGTTYTANNIFGTVGSALGSGFVVYNGNGATVNVSGLSVGVNYTVSIFEYNCLSPFYLTNQILVGSFTTVANPSIVVAPLTPITLIANEGLPGVPQTVSISGSFLTSPIEVSTTIYFEVSLNPTSGFSNFLSLAPDEGDVPETTVYVRFFPTVSSNQTGSLTVSSSGGPQDVIVSLIGNIVVSGTLPAPFALCSGNYNFDNWSADSPAGTYPEHMIFHRFSTNDPGLQALDVADYADAYNSTAQTRINGLGSDGVSFINTGTNGNLGAAVLALNTVGRENIKVDFLAGLITQGTGNPTPREYRLRLQYKIGQGAWSDLQDIVEYSSAGQSNGHVQTFSDIELPEACNNQPQVYLRWFYYQHAVNDGNARPRIRLDNIVVSSTSALPPLSDAVSDEESGSDNIESFQTGEIETNEDGVLVWGFSFRDGGATGDDDNFPTLVNQIIMSPGDANEAADWTSQIEYAALFDDETKVADGIITANQITFTGFELSIADNTFKTLNLRISLSTAGTLIDGARLQFKIDQASISIADACNSSLFANFEIESPSNSNQISVTATQIKFLEIPLVVNVNEQFTVIGGAYDNFDNLDRSSRTVELGFITAGAGVLSSATGLGPRDLVNGIFTWTDLTYSAIGTFDLIATSDDGPDFTISENIQCIDPTHVASVSDKLPVNIYPNPTLDGQIYLNQNFDVQVYDISGRKLVAKYQTNHVNLGEFGTGIYMLWIENKAYKVVVR